MRNYQGIFYKTYFMSLWLVHITSANSTSVCTFSSACLFRRPGSCCRNGWRDPSPDWLGRIHIYAVLPLIYHMLSKSFVAKHSNFSPQYPLAGRSQYAGFSSSPSSLASRSALNVPAAAVLCRFSMESHTAGARRTTWANWDLEFLMQC